MAGRAVLPNILVTGVPGSGKTLFCTMLTDACPTLTHISISQLVKEKCLYDDVEDGCYVINEDRVIDELDDVNGENIMAGGKVIEYHGCDFFPERFFQLVVLLRTDNTLLWGRLEQRGYAAKKIQENVEAEIMQVLVEEARESYKEEIIMEMWNNTTDDLERNLAQVKEWLQANGVQCTQ